MTRVELKRLDEHFEVSLEPGETFLGRGPLLKIDATNISRKHAKLSIGEKGELKLTCLHRIPIFVKKNGEWQELAKDKVINLENEDEVKFLTNSFHYKISILAFLDFDNNDSGDDTKTVAAAKHVEDNNENNDPGTSSTQNFISPPPTRLKVKRKLPDWMQNISPSKKSKIASPDKAAVAKDNGRESDIYLKNVKLINPEWSSEEVNEEELKKAQHVPESLSLKTELSLTSVTKGTSDDKSGSQDSTLDDTIEVAQPSTSKQQARTPMKEAPNKIKESHSPNKQELGATTVLPILVDPSDLIDSDDEPEKENLEQKAKKPLRPSCPFGSSCYRKNPVHRQEEAHPGDDDHKDPDEESEDDERPECEFGTECYRKNPAHRKQFKHSHKPQPNREAKAKVLKKKKRAKDEVDEWAPKFIDDEEEDDWEPVDDSDEDENWAPKLSPVDDSDEDEDWAPKLSPEYE
eukprot:GFUD01021062.1.p1 GENE.GFUD01021062.1~~GFUD01021062.1.p1  ORF type:complete len:462 (-),score=141.06 GFUD01021062.1:166-1551(-)